MKKMDRGKPYLLIVLILTGAFFFISLSALNQAKAESLGAWVQTSSYPITGLGTDDGIQWQSCVSSSGYAYCVGGGNYYTGDSSDIVSYAQLSGSGVSPWKNTTAYPLKIEKEACTASSTGYIYCIGGVGPVNATTASSTSSVYYAQLSASGVGAWTRTTSYPFPATSLSCFTDSDYVYCVGGYTYGGAEGSDSVYFAQLTSSGVGQWRAAGSYPLAVFGQSCTAISGVAVCVGGTISGGFNSTSSSYYASLSSSGVGAWEGTTGYPTSITDESCVPVNGYVYCIGGTDAGYGYDRNAVYYAPLTGSGLGAWTGTTGYPFTVDSLGCASDSVYIYCVGGSLTINQSFFSQVLPTLPSTATATGNVSNGWMRASDYPTPISGAQCASASGFIYCAGGDVTSGGGLNSSGGVASPQFSHSVFYGPLTASGIASWSNTTAYPGDSLQSCVASSGFLYCIDDSGSYFAPISAAGVGNWTATTDYPGGITAFSCVAGSGYVYCVGGAVGSGFSSNSVYFASLSSSGIGTWTSTTVYPILLSGESCVSGSGDVYCIGGGVQDDASSYYATLSSSGVGKWTATTAYPVSAEGVSCTIDTGYVYCIAGGSNSIASDSVYYAPLSGSGIGAWTGTASYPIDAYGLSCVGASGGIYCIGGTLASTSVTGPHPPPLSTIYYSATNLLQVKTTSGASTTTGIASTSSASSTSTTILFGSSQYGAQLVADAYDTHNHMLYVVSFTDPGQVFIVDPASEAVVGNVTVGAYPTSIAFDPANDDLYVAIYGTLEQPGTNVSVISDSSDAVIANVTVGNAPDAVAFDAANEYLYVSNSIDNTVSVIDGASNAVVKTVPVGESPQGVVADPTNGDVYVVNDGDNSVGVIDGSSDSVVKNVTVGTLPQYIAYDPQNGDLYVTCTGDTNGSVSVIQASTDKVVANVTGGEGNVGVAFDSSNGDVYVVGENSNSVAVIAGSSNELVGTLPTGASPLGITFDQDNGDLYVTDVGDQTVTVLSGSSGGASATTSGSNNNVSSIIGGNTSGSSTGIATTTYASTAASNTSSTIAAASSTTSSSSISFSWSYVGVIAVIVSLLTWQGLFASRYRRRPHPH